MASFGADAFRRDVGLGRDVVRAGASRRAPPTCSASARPCCAPARRRSACSRTSSGCSTTSARLIGDFTLFERSASLPPDAPLLVSAGREADQPAFVAFRLGEGLVLRTGTPQWSRELEEARLSVEVPRVTRRIWTLLSGRGDLG